MTSDTVFFQPTVQPRSHLEVVRPAPDNAAARDEDDPGAQGDVARVSTALGPAAPGDLPGAGLAGAGGYSDVANGGRFIADHGDSLRFVATGGRWLVWNERRWVPDELNRSLTLAIKTAKKTVAVAEREDRRAAQHARALEVAATTAGGAATLVAARDERRAASRALVKATGLLQVTQMRNMLTVQPRWAWGSPKTSSTGTPCCSTWPTAPSTWRPGCWGRTGART